MTNELKHTITPDMVYGKEFDTLIPADMEVVAFAPPAKGDLGLKVNGMLITFRDEYGPLEPRLILRKKKRKKIVFTFSHKGRPLKGDWYLSVPHGEILECFNPCKIDGDRDIYTREIVEE
jgi:hypothetical protein